MAPPPLLFAAPLALAVLFINVTLIILIAHCVSPPFLVDTYIAPPSLLDQQFLNIELETV